MMKWLRPGCWRAAFVFLMMWGAVRAAALTTMPDWNLAQPNGPVRAIVQSGNRIYVGGYFTSIGGVARNNLAALDAVTGKVDASWNPDVDNYVFSLTVAGGRLYAGGAFHKVNGTVERHGLASFPLADGKTSATASAWDPKLPTFKNPGVDRKGVYALASFGTKLYVGGVFDSINNDPGSGWFIPPTSVPRNGLAAVQLDDGVNTGTLDMAWNPNGVLTEAAVTSFAVTPGYLYAYLAWGNDYPQGGQAVVALKHANGVGVGLQDPAWHPELHVNAAMVAHYDDYGSVGGYSPDFFSFSSLVIQGSKLYVGGNFDRVETTSRTALAALNLADGVSPAVVDAAWNPQLNFQFANGGVRALAVADGRLIAGGNFTTMGAAAYNLIAAFPLADGSNPGNVDAAWDPKIYAPSMARVSALMPSGGGLCVGGTFTSVRGALIRSLVGFGSSVPVRLGALSVE